METVADAEYNLLYPSGYKKEKELYRVQGLSCKFKDFFLPVRDYFFFFPSLCLYLTLVSLYIHGFIFSAGPEPDVVDYCIDEADDAWIKDVGARLSVSVERFESFIDRLEKATGAQV